VIKVGDRVLFSKYKWGKRVKGIVTLATVHNGGNLLKYLINSDGKEYKLVTFTNIPIEKRRIVKIPNSIDFIWD